MHNVSGMLTRKLGPLPTWAWVAVAVGGLYVARYLRAQRATPTPVADPTSPDPTTDPGVYDTSGTTGDTGLLSDEIQGLQTDVSNLYDLYGSGDPAFAAGTGSVTVGDTGAASAAAPASPAVVAAPTAVSPVAAKDPTPTDTAPLVTGSYTPSTGTYTTPEGVKVAPLTDYSTDPSKPLLGPSIFAFKGAGAYSAPSPAIAPPPPPPIVPGGKVTAF